MGANPRGKAGEDYAAAVLEKLGYRIVGRNVHSRYGEVDIIAQRQGFLCFVEVKTRSRGAMVTGAESVGVSKQRRILRTALDYLSRRPECGLQPRFDLFLVVTDGRGGILEHDYIEGAFDGEAYG